VDRVVSDDVFDEFRDEPRVSERLERLLSRLTMRPATDRSFCSLLANRASGPPVSLRSKRSSAGAGGDVMTALAG
jgi:hypothetical protein